MRREISVLAFFILLLSSTFVLILSISETNISYAFYVRALPESSGQELVDPSLKVELFFKDGIKGPATSMAFLGPDDILLLEKNTGKVQRILNGSLQKDPLLQVKVGTEVEMGLLGIAISKNQQGKTFVFLYYTEANSSGIVIGNRLYRYELIDNKLVNPLLLLNLPATSPILGHENNHIGGKVVIGPDNNVYLVVGDVGSRMGNIQNIMRGNSPDGTSGILRVTQEGKSVHDGPFGSSVPNILYYAYGIRNSFGFDFDPVTGNLWDTENGGIDKDEINYVYPGFNSGWRKMMGMALSRFDPNVDLFYFNGKGKYSDPEFVWKETVAPTALKFLNSSQLGPEYENTIFVGDVKTGNLYNFKLDSTREQLQLNPPLDDKVADTPQEIQDIIFGKGFGVITDIQVGSDGYLYILGIDGTIYKIVQV
ncbi:MAG TPA: PQQ-dependent sugar dehydrogenase [Nitrososphaeraceae archaeon]|jgi:glucose/arabinose dehydrogenase|nr:PQQ-dependent sugar dehydrogenase [Nitrososphaeraceae archaeon]